MSLYIHLYTGIGYKVQYKPMYIKVIPNNTRTALVCANAFSVHYTDSASNHAGSLDNSFFNQHFEYFTRGIDLGLQKELSTK